MVQIATSLLTLTGVFVSLVGQVGASVVIHVPQPNAISGLEQVVSASVVGVSAIGLAADGATRYVVTEVESFAGLVSGTRTSTLLSKPTTVVFTMEQDASRYSAYAAQVTTVAGVAVSGGVEVKCTGNGNGGEVDCVQAVALSAKDVITTTITDKYTATTLPIFTITATDPVPTNTGAPTSGANRAVLSMTSASLFVLLGFLRVVL